VLTVTPEALIREIGPDLVNSHAAMALVKDDEGHLVGVLTKTDLVTRRRLQVILVDHSERNQSVDGIEHATILEILDHHRLGGLQTAEPILALIAPVEGKEKVHVQHKCKVTGTSAFFREVAG
jgi:manganese-dependent inorganic pyrophosphatase